MKNYKKWKHILNKSKYIKFGDIEYQKQKLPTLVSKKVSFRKKGFKHFIGYKVVRKNRPLCIFLPKMTAYRKEFYETKCISFLIKDHELLEKHNEI